MDQNGVQRKLAAILAADVAGYSRLMGLDEEGTLARLSAHRDELIDPKIAEHRGRIVKTTGDGLLVDFASVVDAISCAVAIQRAMSGRNAGVSDDERIQFRIGVNLGDVMVKDDDLFGDGVNVAARIEGLAESGGICLSRAARDQVRDKLDIALEDMGEIEVKNIARPVRVFRVAARELSPAAPVGGGQASDAPALPDKPSIVVLPFENMTRDPEQEFFADGITEDISTALSRLRGFFVIARNTTFALKGAATDSRKIARELGVRYVLEGSVRKAGERVRVTARLTDASTGNQLWGERYDRGFDDVFAIQDEITANVVGCIEPELYAAEHERLRRTPPQNLDAWECFIRGMFLYSQHSEEGSGEALVALERCIELDGGYGQAHGLMAFTIVWRAFQGWEEMGAAIAKGTAAADRAVTCDPQEPWAYLARGMIGFATRDNDETVAALRRATDLSPNFAYAQCLLGDAYAFGGRPDEAMRCVDLAVRLSPRDIFGDDFQLCYAFLHFQAERYADCARHAEMAIQERPGHAVPHMMAAASYALSGDEGKAEAARDRLMALNPRASATEVERTFPYVLAEDRARLKDGLRRAGVPD